MSDLKFTLDDTLNILSNAIYNYKNLAQDDVIHKLINRLFNGNLFIPENYENLLKIKLKTKGIILEAIDPNQILNSTIKGPASYYLVSRYNGNRYHKHYLIITTGKPYLIYKNL